VPANFNEVQRSCTKLAGERVGLEVVRVLNEPTAAALAYGFEQGLEERIAIYDFGGGTFDITLLELKGDIFEVLATAGDSFLGGDDIDLRLVEYMISAFMKLYHYDLRGDELAIQRLTQVAEQIKCQLSASSKTKVHIKELAYGENNQPLDLIFSITRSGFYARISDIVDRTFKVADEAFKIAGIEPQDIDKVILVGGSTRMPLVREKVKGYFSKEPLCHLDPDQVVALGAAIYGEVLTEKSKTVEKKTLKGIPALASPGKPSFKSAQIPPPPRALLLDVTPRTLGIATVGGYCDHIIERNAAIPVEQTRVFTTSRDFQTEVKIIITQGESRRIEENMILGELELKDLKPAPRGEVKIEVTFEIDVNGIIQIKARDQETGKEQKVKLTIHGTLSEEELEKFTRKRESSTVEPLKNLVK
jgi:molecular chaperone DnaK